jgi:predicted O-methyltransferase YrrM
MLSGHQMNYPKLRALLESVLAGRNDSIFDHIFAQIHCMSRPRVYAVLNAIVSSMDTGELYVEVGTYQGGSLIAALQGNDAEAIGVDNFAEFSTTNNFEQTLGNLGKFGVAHRASLKNMSYKDFFDDVPGDYKIQVYNYDGAHDYESQLAGMQAAWAYLQPGSIIIVDDLLYSEVNRAVNQFIADHVDRVKVLLMVDSMNDCDSVWWNGVCVLRVI